MIFRNVIMAVTDVSGHGVCNVVKGGQGAIFRIGIIDQAPNSRRESVIAFGHSSIGFVIILLSEAFECGIQLC
jgi:hypothetical protein